MRSFERALSVAALLALGSVLLAPLLGEGSALHAVFAPLCHQMPERSPALLGVALPVCWRCLGVFVGLAAVAVLWRRDALGDRRAWPWLLALGVGDFALKQLGLVADLGIERLVSGVCLGLGMPLALRAGWCALTEAHRAWRPTRRLFGLSLGRLRAPHRPR
jgi:uncharacterized membrane protein